LSDDVGRTQNTEQHHKKQEETIANNNKAKATVLKDTAKPNPTQP
jgi:hypothetical protein